MHNEEVLIVGGGLAGLTLAIALAEQGRSAVVVDQRASWDIAGWGVSLTGPMLRALDALGLADACVGRGYGITQITNCTAAGEVRGVITPPRLAGSGRPAMAGIFRPVLHRVLLDRAAECDLAIRLATTVDRLDDDGDGVDVTFSDGSVARFGAVVGADGVHSRVRSLIGIPTTPRFTGQTVWRALVDRPPWATSLHTFAGPVHNAGLIPISETHAYVFLTEATPEPMPVADEDRASVMRALLADFSGRLAAVREQIVDPESIVRRPVEALLVPLPWHRGRVVLIGDAVHAPSPQLVSGAALAVEDAVVLSASLDGEESFARFGDRRYERCRMVVESSVQIGEWEREGRHAEVHALQDRCFGALAAAI